MQQCQDQLGFQIETPSNKELAKRFANRQKARAGEPRDTSTFTAQRLLKEHALAHKQERTNWEKQHE